ncbi:jg26272, partial [Pararge aegeria aegeria]
YDYEQGLQKSITAELEACFAAGVSLLTDELHVVPATLLCDDVARDYCSTLITGLHG